MQQMILITDLIAYSTCFGHHYAHHQELESIIKVVAACGIWCFGFQVVGMVWSWGLCVRFAGSCNHLYNTLELLMMGIMVPETCWASNKICNKNHLLHLVGIFFPHIKVALFLTANLTFPQFLRSYSTFIRLCKHSDNPLQQTLLFFLEQ